MGIALALACAVATQLGFLCKHRGATQAPRVELRRPLRSAAALLRSKWFAIGMGIGAGAFAPARRRAGARAALDRPGRALDRRRHARRARRPPVRLPGRPPPVGRASAMTATGLVLLVAHAARRPTARSAAFAVPGAGRLRGRHARPRRAADRRAAARRAGRTTTARCSAPSAGVLFGVSDVAIKALTTRLGGALACCSPWLLVAVIAAVLAFLASARGFQQGDAVPVIACTSTAANVTCIVGGIVVFGDALAGGIAAVRGPDRRLRARRRRRAGDADAATGASATA